MPSCRLIAMVALAFLAGCGWRAELGQVEGTVRVKGGQPLAGVVVTFVPEAEGAPRSLAQSGADGRYILKTEDGRHGAHVGKHRVTVEDLSILSAPRSPDGTVLKRPPQRFSTDYADPLRTPLQFDVKPEAQTIDLELRR
jgi:hypothetical protein